MSNPVMRYSDEDLAFFKQIVEEKIRKTQEQLDMLQEQILEITENSSDEHGGDWVDDSSINNEVEMLNNMAIRQRMYLQDLQNALLRIRNKSYGICVVTGELIDKKRLIAVPTTTKSLAAKTGGAAAPAREKSPQRAARPGGKSGSQPRVITKVIRKSNNPAKPKPPVDDEEEDEETLDFDLYPEADLGDDAPELDELSDEEEDLTGDNDFDNDFEDDEDEDDK